MHRSVEAPFSMRDGRSKFTVTFQGLRIYILLSSILSTLCYLARSRDAVLDGGDALSWSCDAIGKQPENDTSEEEWRAWCAMTFGYFLGQKGNPKGSRVKSQPEFINCIFRLSSCSVRQRVTEAQVSQQNM